MLQLYHNDMSVCAAKVRVALAEKGLDWAGVHMNLRAGDALRPDYLALNPNGVVPTLVHDGGVVIESTVICEYLDDAFPDPGLRPATALERARMRLWTKRLDDELHAAIGTLSMCIAFREQHLSKTPAELEAYLRAVPSAEARERRRIGIERGMDAPTFVPALDSWSRALQAIEDVLEGSAWLAGDTFSLADTGYMPYIVRLEHLGLDSLWRARRRVAAWRERLFARPSYRTAIEAWLNPSYLALFAARRDAVRSKLGWTQ